MIRHRNRDMLFPAVVGLMGKNTVLHSDSLTISLCQNGFVIHVDELVLQG